MAGGPFVLGLDVGTTNVRCHVYGRDTCSRGYASEKVELVFPHSGWVEICPEAIWASVVSVIRGALADAGVCAQDISCLGISTQRNSFTTWHRHTGRPFHPLISWQDRRTADLVEQWNGCCKMKLLRAGSWLLYQVTRQKRFLLASVYHFLTATVPIRLHWVLKNVPEVASCLPREEVQFGTLDTWLLWKLTAGNTCCTDYGNASATGLFDTFKMDWSGVFMSLLGIPDHVMPPVVNSGGDLGSTDPDLFGCAIPITALLADQQAALFGHCGFRPGDLKCSMGTGSFLTVNTGQNIHASMKGIYPLVGWRTREEVVYVAEAMAGDAGRCVDWLVDMGFLKTPEESEPLARSVTSSDGVRFIPGFSGMQMPYNDPRACAGLVGLTTKTRPAHVVRATIEALACHCALLVRTMEQELPGTSKRIRVDGGVSQNRLVLELLATLSGRELVVPCGRSDLASLGAAFMAGLQAGVWNSKEELAELRKTTSVHPSPDNFEYDVTEEFHEWERAVNRLLDWYS